VKTAEFLATKLGDIDEELRGAILNRGRWSALCDDRKLLVFLEERHRAPDFFGIQGELERIAAGHARIPGIEGPRKKATEFLRDWASYLKTLD
jgi:hypothetical protein